MRAGWTLGVAIPTVVVVVVVVAAQDPDLAPGGDTIRADDLQADVGFLAGDHMQGRRTGTPGNRQAAEFIASRFDRLGLSGVGTNGSHFQSFDLITTGLGDDNRLEVPGVPATDVTFGSAYYPDPTSASGTAGGEVVFVGFGISAAALEHDDYQSSSALDGKVALILNHEP
ncbi:MAG: hypothetical protein ABGY72_11965, partial [bacterium]